MWAWRMVSSNKPEKKGFNLHLHQSDFPAEFHISLQQFAGWELRAGRGVQSWMRALRCASCRGQPLLITALTAGESKAFISVFLHAGHSHQCFCLPATTSKTCEYIFCFLHLLVLHFCWHTCKYHHVCSPSFWVFDWGWELNLLYMVQPFFYTLLEELSCPHKKVDRERAVTSLVFTAVWAKPTSADKLWHKKYHLCDNATCSCQWSSRAVRWDCRDGLCCRRLEVGPARHMQKSVTSQAWGTHYNGRKLQQMAFPLGSSRGSSTQQLWHPKRAGLKC